VVGDLVAVPLTQDGLPDFQVPGEHLVEMVALSMGLGARVDRRSKTQRSELLDDVAHVVVEVTTDNYRSVRVLPDDISDDFTHSLGSLLQVRLFSRLQVAIENLDVVVAEL